MAGPWEDYAGVEEDGPWADYAAPRQVAPLQERLAAGRQKLEELNPDLFRPAPPPVRQTVGGELAGGLSQFISDMGTMIGGDRKQPDMGYIERGLHGARSGLGLIRAAAPILTAGLSPSLANISAKMGEKTSDMLQKLGLTTTADVGGALTQAAADVASGRALNIGAVKASEAARRRFPVAAERTTATRLQQAELAKGVESEADSAAAAAQRELASSEASTKAAISSEESLAAGAADYAKKQAEAARRDLPSSEKVAALAPRPGTSEAIGKDFVEKVYAPKRKASTERFNKEYGEVQADAAKVEAAAENYAAAAEKIFGKEKGITRPLATKAEGVAGKARFAVDVEEEAADQVAALQTAVNKAATPEAKIVAQGALDEYSTALGLPERSTLADLITERQRLKGAERAAYTAGNDNLGRQFKEMQRALGEDISDASPEITKRLSAVDASYKADHVPLFGYKSHLRSASEVGPEAVVDKLIPHAKDPDRVAKITNLERLVDDPAQRQAIGDAFIKNMVSDSTVADQFNVGKLVSRYARYEDSRSGDKVLRSVLGDRYAPFRELVSAAQKVKPKTVDETLKVALKNINANLEQRSGSFTKAHMARESTLEGMLGSPASKIGGVDVPGKTGSIEKTKLTKLDDLQKEFDKKLAKMGPVEVPKHAGQLVGGATILHGIIGVIMGNAAAVPTIIAGGLVMLSAPMMFRMINTARGMDLLARSMRATPGTAAAAANARQIQKYFEDEKNGKKK